MPDAARGRTPRGRRASPSGGTRSAPGRGPSTPSSPISRNRSAGSNAPSWSTVAAPAAPRAEQDVPDRLRPARAGGAPDDVVRRRVEPALGLRALGPRVAVRVHDALRILRRPGGVEDERRILGAGVGGRRRRLAELGLAGVDDLGRLGHRLDLGARRRGRRRAAALPSGEHGSRDPWRAASPSRGSRPRRPSAPRASPRTSPASCRSARARGRRERRRARGAGRPSAQPPSVTSPKVRSRTRAGPVAEAKRVPRRILRLDDVAGEVEPGRCHRGRRAIVVVLVAISVSSAYASPWQTVSRPPRRTTRPRAITRSPTARLEQVDLVLDRQHVGLALGWPTRPRSRRRCRAPPQPRPRAGSRAAG